MKIAGCAILVNSGQGLFLDYQINIACANCLIISSIILTARFTWHVLFYTVFNVFFLVDDLLIFS